jgi:ribosomal protein S18 acetylase RimI-like enzyme
MKHELSLRPAAPDDRPFVEQVYFETQRWLIEKLFGWRGESVERAKFNEFYDEAHTSIIHIGDQRIGWMTLIRDPERIEIDAIYIEPNTQRRGFGTRLMQDLILESEQTGKPLTLSTAKINPARRLYERLAFTVVNESEVKVYMEREPHSRANCASH